MRGRRAKCCSAFKHPHDLVFNRLRADAEVPERLGRDAIVFPQQTQQQVLRAHVVVLEVPRCFHRVLDHLLGTRRLTNRFDRLPIPTTDRRMLMTPEVSGLVSATGIPGFGGASISTPTRTF